MNFRLVALATLLVAINAFGGGNRRLGVITTTGAGVVRTNGSTAAPFVITPPMSVMVQCYDGAATVIADTVTVLTATTGVQIPEDFPWPDKVSQKLITISSTPSGVVQVVSSSGIVNCNVFEAAQ